MDDCRCSICNSKMVDFPHVASPLDDVKCPICRCFAIEFLIPQELGEVDVDCRCPMGHEWSVRVVLPKNLFG